MNGFIWLQCSCPNCVRVYDVSSCFFPSVDFLSLSFCPHSYVHFLFPWLFYKWHTNPLPIPKSLKLKTLPLSQSIKKNQSETLIPPLPYAYARQQKLLIKCQHVWCMVSLFFFPIKHVCICSHVHSYACFFPYVILFANDFPITTMCSYMNIICKISLKNSLLFLYIPIPC